MLNEIPEVEITAAVNNGSDLMEKFRSTTVDLVLLDLNMPKIDGLKSPEIGNPVAQHSGAGRHW